jgi:iron(III) transport system permease protein
MGGSTLIKQSENPFEWAATGPTARSQLLSGVASASRVLPVIILSIIALAPVVIVVAGSFRTSLPGTPVEWGLSGWVAAFSSKSIWDSIVNTVILSLMRIPISVVIACALAWLLIRTNIYAGKAIEFLFWIAFFLPTLPIAMAWVLLLEPHSGWINVFAERYLGIAKPFFNIYSYWGITWVHISATTVPVMVLLLGPAIRALDRSMEDSARMSGAGRVATLRFIVAPLILPSLLVATIACLIRSLEAFEIELYLGLPAGIRVYATKIHELAVWEPPRYAPAMALSVPFVAILFLLAMAHQRFLQKRNFVTVTGKSAPGTPIDLGRWRLPLSLLCMAIAGIVVVIPMLALLLGSFMEVFGVLHMDGSFVLTLEHWQIVLDDPVFQSSVINTLKIATITAVLSIVVFSLIAYFILRSEAPGRNFLGLAVWLPWAFPGILLSLAFLWIFLGTPGLNVLYGSLASLVLAMMFKEMPIAVNLMKGNLLQIGAELEEAGRISGAGWWRRYWHILLPLLGPTAVTVGMLAFIGTVKDISSMILLATPETRPLSLLVLDYSTSGSIENGAVAGVIASSMAIVAALFGRAIGMQVGKK